MRPAALLVLFALFSLPAAAQIPACGPSVLCVENAAARSAEPKKSKQPSFVRLAGAGVLGAAAGTGVLLVVAEAVQAEFSDDDGYQSEEEERADAAAILLFLPWIGSTTAVLAASGGDTQPEVETIIVVAGSSLLASLLGAGLGYGATRSGVGALAGFAAGAGAGAALGYRAAERNGYAARRPAAGTGLLRLRKGRWAVGAPSVRRVASGLPQHGPLRLVSLLSAQL